MAVSKNKASRMDCCREERTEAALKKQDASKNHLQDNEAHTRCAETEGSEIGDTTGGSTPIQKEVSLDLVQSLHQVPFPFLTEIRGWVPICAILVGGYFGRRGVKPSYNQLHSDGTH